jgi:hypothetical protein
MLITANVSGDEYGEIIMNNQILERIAGLLFNKPADRLNA